jgi:hypothetical protein
MLKGVGTLWWGRGLWRDFKKIRRQRGREASPLADDLHHVGACLLRARTCARLTLSSFGSSPAKMELTRRHMTISFLSYGKGWETTKVDRLNGLSLACRSQSRGWFLGTTHKTTFLSTVDNSTTRNTTHKFLSASPITFSNSDSSVGSRLQASESADRQTRTKSMGSSC